FVMPFRIGRRGDFPFERACYGLSTRRQGGWNRLGIEDGPYVPLPQDSEDREKGMGRIESSPRSGVIPIEVWNRKWAVWTCSGRHDQRGLRGERLKAREGS